jgi:outer membrane protein assembly factor BamB
MITLRPGLVLAALLALSAAGCSTPDNSEPPAELTDIADALPVAEMWSVDTGRGSDKNAFDLQPLLLDGKIYTIDTRGLIKQIDAVSGRAEWKYDSGLASASGLGGTESSLIASSREGFLVRLDMQGKTLEEKWRRQLLSEIRNRAVIDGGQVLLRTVDGKLTALGFDSGNILWSVSQRVPPLSLTGNSHPLISGDLVISGFDNGKLVAFERDNGGTAWEATVGTPSGRSEIERLVDLDGQFILRDGVVYVSSFQGNLAAVTANSGQVLWSRKFSSYQSMDADADALYLTDERSHVWSIDRRTGSAFWKQEALSARKLTAPRLVDDMLVVGDLDGYVHFLSREDGRLLARINPNGERYISQPLARDSVAILLDNTGQLTALTLRR